MNQQDDLTLMDQILKLLSSNRSVFLVPGQVETNLGCYVRRIGHFRQPLACHAAMPVSS